MTKLLYFLYLHFNSSPKIRVWYMHNQNPKSQMCVWNKNETLRKSEIIFESLRHIGVYETLSGEKRVRVKIWVWAWKHVIKMKSARGRVRTKWERCEWAYEERYMRENRKTFKRMGKWEEMGDGWELWEIICEK